MPDHLDAATLWDAYGRHAGVVLSAGPAPAVARTPGMFLALSGAPYVDLNQAALFGGADRDTTAILGDLVREADVPCLLGVSATVVDDVSGVLTAAGFRAANTVEALFVAAEPPPVAAGFAVRLVETPADHAALQRLFTEIHSYDPALIARLFGPDLLDRADVDAWVAWDGREPVSCVIVTRVDRTLGVFEMMTAPRHRRRGAGRAVLTAALAEAWTVHDGGAEAVVFWSSPAGRPLYESMGFTVADEVRVWTLGASPEDLAAVGAG